MTAGRRDNDRVRLDPIIQAVVRQARADNLALPGDGPAAFTALLRRQGFDAPPLRPTVSVVARLLAELLVSSRSSVEIGRDKR